MKASVNGGVEMKQWVVSVFIFTILLCFGLLLVMYPWLVPASFLAVSSFLLIFIIKSVLFSND